MLGYSWHVWAALETINTYRCRIDLFSLQGLKSKLILYALNLRSRKDRNTKTQHFHIHSLEVSKNALKNEFTDYKSRIFSANHFIHKSTIRKSIWAGLHISSYNWKPSYFILLLRNNKLFCSRCSFCFKFKILIFTPIKIR